MISNLDSSMTFISKKSESRSSRTSEQFNTIPWEMPSPNTTLTRSSAVQVPVESSRISCLASMFSQRLRTLKCWKMRELQEEESEQKENNLERPASVAEGQGQLWQEEAGQKRAYRKLRDGNVGGAEDVTTEIKLITRACERHTGPLQKVHSRDFKECQPQPCICWFPHPMQWGHWTPVPARGKHCIFYFREFSIKNKTNKNSTTRSSSWTLI